MASGTKRIAIDVSPTVLIVDDDESVRTLAATTLEQAGFFVLLACDGEAAIEIFRSGRLNVDTLLTDVQMGNGITGIALAQHILNEGRKSRPRYAGSQMLYENLLIISKPRQNPEGSNYDSWRYLEMVVAYLLEAEHYAER